MANRNDDAEALNLLAKHLTALLIEAPRLRCVALVYHVEGEENVAAFAMAADGNDGALTNTLTLTGAVLQLATQLTARAGETTDFRGDRN